MTAGKTGGKSPIASGAAIANTGCIFDQATPDVQYVFDDVL